MTDQERRRKIRIPCNNRWIDVSTQSKHRPDKNELPVNVKVENISDTGGCLISSTPFDLDLLIIFSEDDMPNQGTVVWTLQSKNECKSGIQFLK